MMKSVLLAAALLRRPFRPPLATTVAFPVRLVLSPDLAAPWIMQLNGGNVRPVVYQRPVACSVPSSCSGHAGCCPARRAPCARRAAGVGRHLRYSGDPQPATAAVPAADRRLPDEGEAPGSIVIDTNNRFLYLVMTDSRRDATASASASRALVGRRAEGQPQGQVAELDAAIRHDLARGGEGTLPAGAHGRRTGKSARRTRRISAPRSVVSMAPMPHGRSRSPSPRAAFACAMKTSSISTSASKSAPGRRDVSDRGRRRASFRRPGIFRVPKLEIPVDSISLGGDRALEGSMKTISLLAAAVAVAVVEHGGRCQRRARDDGNRCRAWRQAKPADQAAIQEARGSPHHRRSARHRDRRYRQQISLSRRRPQPGHALRHRRRPRRLRLVGRGEGRAQAEWPTWTPPAEMRARRPAPETSCPPCSRIGPTIRSARAVSLPGRPRRFSAFTAPTSPGRSASTCRRAASAWSTRMSSSFTSGFPSAPR